MGFPLLIERDTPGNTRDETGTDGGLDHLAAGPGNNGGEGRANCGSDTGDNR